MWATPAPVLGPTWSSCPTGPTTQVTCLTLLLVTCCMSVTHVTDAGAGACGPQVSVHRPLHLTDPVLLHLLVAAENIRVKRNEMGSNKLQHLGDVMRHLSPA
jgi:hypothetical protein